MPTEETQALVAEVRAVEAKMTRGKWRACIGKLSSIMLGDTKLEVIGWPGFDSSDFPRDVHWNLMGIVTLRNNALALCDIIDTLRADIEQRERAELRRTLPTPDSIAAELTRDKTELEAKVAEQAEELSEIAAAIGSVRFMDPPDGGSVTLAEQVTRMREALANAEARGRDE